LVKRFLSAGQQRAEAGIWGNDPDRGGGARRRAAEAMPRALRVRGAPAASGTKGWHTTRGGKNHNTKFPCLPFLLSPKITFH